MSSSNGYIDSEKIHIIVSLLYDKIKEQVPFYSFFFFFFAALYWSVFNGGEVVYLYSGSLLWFTHLCIPHYCHSGSNIKINNNLYLIFFFFFPRQQSLSNTLPFVSLAQK